MKKLIQSIKCFFGFHGGYESWMCIDDCHTYEPVLQCRNCGIISQWWNRK